MCTTYGIFHPMRYNNSCENKNTHPYTPQRHSLPKLKHAGHYYSRGMKLHHLTHRASAWRVPGSGWIDAAWFDAHGSHVRIRQDQVATVHRCPYFLELGKNKKVRKPEPELKGLSLLGYPLELVAFDYIFSPSDLSQSYPPLHAL